MLIPKKIKNACRDELLPKHTKVAEGYVLVKSIIIIIEKIQASYKNKQEAIKIQKKIEVIAELELAKTQAKKVRELYKS